VSQPQQPQEQVRLPTSCPAIEEATGCWGPEIPDESGQACPNPWKWIRCGPLFPRPGKYGTDRKIYNAGSDGNRNHRVRQRIPPCEVGPAPRRQPASSRPGVRLGPSSECEVTGRDPRPPLDAPSRPVAGQPSGAEKLPHCSPYQPRKDHSAAAPSKLPVGTRHSPRTSSHPQGALYSPPAVADLGVVGKRPSQGVRTTSKRSSDFGLTKEEGRWIPGHLLSIQQDALTLMQ